MPKCHISKGDGCHRKLRPFGNVPRSGEDWISLRLSGVLLLFLLSLSAHFMRGVLSFGKHVLGPGAPLPGQARASPEESPHNHIRVTPTHQNHRPIRSHLGPSTDTAPQQCISHGIGA